jgi:hypothetical protein
MRSCILYQSIAAYTTQALGAFLHVGHRVVDPQQATSFDH